MLQEATDFSSDMQMKMNMASGEQLAAMAEADAQQMLETMRVEAAAPTEKMVRPLAVGLDLYVESKWPDPDKRMTMKTTYSWGAENNAD